MMLQTRILLLSIVSLVIVTAGPVKRPEPTTTPKGPEDPADDDWAKLEYFRYLQEVVNVIETDPALKEKFGNATEEDIKSGKVVESLDFHEGVRDKLSEIKRREIERLRQAMSKLIEKEQYEDIRIPDHLDHGDAENFSKDDLKKLINKTTNDLEELDKKRKEQFKEYEMKKKHDYEAQLKHAANEEEKKKLQAEHEEKEKKHKEHEKLKHPGSKDQLQEVWEERDKLDKESFDMRTLFGLHDLNGDGYLEEDELDALFQGELDKVYDGKNSEDDMKERMEEEARMREHVQQEMDKDKDGLVSLDEWLAEEKEADFDNKEEWKAIDDEDEFTDEEFKLFEEQYAMEEKKGVPEALPPAHVPDPQTAPQGNVPVQQGQVDPAHPANPAVPAQ